MDIIQPIEQTLRTHRLNARDKKVELLHDVEPNLPAVIGNYDLLLQVFSNLVGNALKFTEPGGQVMLRAHQILPCGNDPNEESYVRIEISDTGIGIAPEDQQAIFDRFFRVENRVHTLEGTGLGLSIVKNIIEKHSSEVHLVSEVGIGTTFWFDVAAYQPEAIAVAAENASNSEVDKDLAIAAIAPTLAESPSLAPQSDLS